MFNLTSKVMSMVAGASLVATATFMVPSEAGAVPVVQLDTVAGQQLPVEKSAYFYGGRRYCFYRRGWHGAGFYPCGRPFVRGFFFAPGFRGWGGGFRGGYGGGFHRGFRYHGFHGGFRHRGGRHFGHMGGHHGGHFGGHHGGGHHGGGHGGGHHGGGHHR